LRRVDTVEHAAVEYFAGRRVFALVENREIERLDVAANPEAVPFLLDEPLQEGADFMMSDASSSAIAISSASIASSVARSRRSSITVAPYPRQPQHAPASSASNFAVASVVMSSQNRTRPRIGGRCDLAAWKRRDAARQIDFQLGPPQGRPQQFSERHLPPNCSSTGRRRSRSLITVGGIGHAIASAGSSHLTPLLAAGSYSGEMQ
jgi:hypothetical protein